MLWLPKAPVPWLGFAAVVVWLLDDSLRSAAGAAGISISTLKAGLACPMLGISIEPSICCSEVNIFLDFPAYCTDLSLL